MVRLHLSQHEGCYYLVITTLALNVSAQKWTSSFVNLALIYAPTIELGDRWCRLQNPRSTDVRRMSTDFTMLLRE
jgi:hypothetical protein